MGITLRPHQQDCLDSVRTAYLFEEKSRLVVEMPPAAGKTKFALKLFQVLLSSQESALFLVPFKDLVEQTLSSALEVGFRRQEIGLVWESHNEVDRRIIIASVPTLDEPGRLESLVAAHPHQFAIVVCDEAHRALCTSWQRVVGATLADYGLLLGMTATPYRSDRQSLQILFTEGLVYSIDFLTLIAMGYLVPVQTHKVDTTLPQTLLKEHKIGKAKKDASKKKQLAQAYRYQQAYQQWKQLAYGLPTLIYAQDVHDAYGFTQYWEDQGAFPCTTITGRTPSHIRDEHYALLRKGELVVSNYGVLTTGTDIPEVRCIILARETDNDGLLTQVIGRGIRADRNNTQFGEKTHLILIDLTKGEHILTTMEFLPGRLGQDTRSPRQYLREEVETLAQEELGEEANLDTEEEIYALMQRVTEARASRDYDVFTGGDWVRESVTGDWLLHAHGQGTYRAERSVMGYSLVFTPTNGRPYHFPTAAASSTLLTAYEAKTKARQHLARRRMGQATDPTTLPIELQQQVQRPISADHLKYLQVKRKIHTIGDVETMQEKHYYTFQRHLSQYGSNYTDSGGTMYYNAAQGCHIRPNIAARRSIVQKKSS